ncbi:MAG: CPBP family intramembrane glutamic endopeptidase [Promethearchaeota archaeon]
MAQIRKKIIEHPYVAVAILLFLFTGVLLFPHRFMISYSLRFGEDYFSIIFFNVLLPFSLLFFFWNLIVPFGFFLEDDENSSFQILKDYHKIIKLSSVEHMGRILLLSFICIIIYYFFVVTGAFILGTSSWDFSILFRNIEINEDLGWFNFITYLRAPIWEEITFRGVILAIFLNAFSKRKAIILNGLIFGLFHFINFLISYSEIWSSLLDVLALMGFGIVIGIFLAYMFTKTENLISCIVIHYFINIIFLIFFVSIENIGLMILYHVFFRTLMPWIVNSLLIRYVYKYWEQEHEQSLKNKFMNKKRGFKEIENS